jgi:hypothetical protein
VHFSRDIDCYLISRELVACVVFSVRSNELRERKPFPKFEHRCDIGSARVLNDWFPAALPEIEILPALFVSSRQVTAQHLF